MSEIATISAALRRNPEGIRCFIAYPPFADTRGPSCDCPLHLNRGSMGTLERSPMLGHLMFTSDTTATGHKAYRVHFRWKQWQGIHIPSLNIIRM